MKARQLQTGVVKDGEPDLRVVDLEAIEEQCMRDATEPYNDRFADNAGGHVDYETAKGAHVNDIRFAGHLHLDRRPLEQGGWIWHWDAFGSGFRNPGQTLQHILFEAGPLTSVFGRDLPYAYYRTQHLLRVY